MDYKPTSNSPSGKAVQTPASATSKCGQGMEVREVWAAVLLRIGLERPTHNQSELTWASKPECGIATMQKALT